MLSQNVENKHTKNQRLMKYCFTYDHYACTDESLPDFIFFYIYFVSLVILQLIFQ